MKVFFSKRAEIGLEKIFEHVMTNFTQEQARIIRDELIGSILKLESYPELGNKIANQADKRVLFVAGNAIIYEIILKKDPCIVIRNIRPQGNV